MQRLFEGDSAERAAADAGARAPGESRCSTGKRALSQAAQAGGTETVTCSACALCFLMIMVCMSAQIIEHVLLLVKNIMTYC